MPVLKRYQGKPVTRIEKVSDTELQITFANVSVGDRKRRLTITPAEWEQFGESEYVTEMPNLRALASAGQ
jgi:hypothetical protein